MSVTVGISTQTPLLRLSAPLDPNASGDEARVPLKDKDLTISPGGVCRLVLGNVRRWYESGWLKRAQWLSLQPGAPPTAEFPGLPLTLRHLDMPKEELAAYARTKEHFWAEIHGTEGPVFDLEDFRSYARYNWLTSKALLQHLGELDVIYVHDFQLTQVGAMVGLASPTVLRWHVPFDAQRIRPYTRNFLVRTLEDFDAVIVSTRRDLEGLMRAGFHGNARQLYPSIDTREWPDPKPEQLAEFEERCGLKPDTQVILCVARMDPMKRQDLLIQAFAKTRHRFPDARLVFVGNGSFSNLKAGGLGLSKSERWSARLRDLVQELREEERVIFAHWLPDNLLAAAYSRSAAVVLCSDIEGFGLTVFEGWRYGRPTIVTDGCGISEVIQDGVNGLIVPSGDADSLAKAIEQLLGSSEQQAIMGAAARQSVRNHEASRQAGSVSATLQEAIEHFDALGGRPAR